MRNPILAASALLLAFGIPARAQQQPAPPRNENVQTELIELEQDVDKALLREAMMLLGRKNLKPSSERPTSDEARKREAEDAAVLEDYIQRKKQAIIERAGELRKGRAESFRARMAQIVPKAPEADRQGLIEKMEGAQVEVQLLQTQVQAFQQPLSQAIQELTAAELAASQDANQRSKAEEARKGYEKAKSKFVEISKRFQVEQGKLAEMQQSMGGMGGGGMGGGGMGGGFR